MSVLPGIAERHYHFNLASSFRYFSAKGLGLLRVPIRWERIQPVPGGPLDQAYLAGLRRNADDALASGGAIAIDVQNFGRFNVNEVNGAVREHVIDAASNGAVFVSRADFADLWSRLSAEFRDHDGVWAYDLINEPHDMGSSNWKAISQAAVNAIRANADGKRILIPGDNWSNAELWPRLGAESWIVDPANNIEYTAHLYFDSDYSGSYAQSFDDEFRRNPALLDIGRKRVAPFIDWCRRNNVRGNLGEYGVPNSDARWLTVLDRFLFALDEAGFTGMYWAAGEWWGDYPLSVQPRDFATDRLQTPVLLAHLPADTLTVRASPSAGGLCVAPDSLAIASFGSADESAEVELLDSGGFKRYAQVVVAAPGEVEFVVPPATAIGMCEVRVLGRVGRVYVDSVAPSLFAQAQVQRVGADGSSVFEAAGEIRFGPEGERLFLILYGSGIRGGSEMRLQVGAELLAVTFAGPQGGQAGLDQVVAEMPRSLAGTGRVLVVMRVMGRAANVVPLVFGEG